MAQVNWMDFSNSAAQNEQTAPSNNRDYVRYFSLRDDGDEALVRIMHHSPEDFDIIGTHQITYNGRNRRVSCLRTPSDPVDACPLCENGTPLQYRMYVHLLEYVHGDDGQVQVVPKVWERPAMFANTLKNYCDEYGDLSDCIFRVKRNGKRGDMNTTYDLIYANPKVYNDVAYPKKAELIEDYTALGNACLDLSREEMLKAMASDVSDEEVDTATARVSAPAEPHRTYTPTGAAPATTSTERPVRSTPAVGSDMPVRPRRFYS